MTEIKSRESFQELEQNIQFDLLFEIYRLRIVRKKLISKLKSFEKLLKSGHTSNIQYKFEALKVIITENDTHLKNLIPKLDADCNLFELTNILEECELYLKNLMKERKKKRVNLETFEITKGHYLQKMIDIKDNIKQLNINASAYFQELRDELIALEDQRIILTTEKMRKNLTKEEFKEKLKEIENLKQKNEEKLAFLKVKILDFKID